MKDNSKFGSSDSLIAAVRSIMEKEHTVPKGDKEKKLAALAHPKDKITHKDVLVGRGVLKKENSGERMGTIVATRKEKVELDPKLKEEEQVDERKLTGAETDKKEKYVMSLKKKMGGFKKRYGERAKEVMYATATKMAKEEVELDEIDSHTADDYRKEKRYDSPEQKAKREKEQQHRLKSISPELRRKLKLPEPKKTNEEVKQIDEISPKVLKSYVKKAEKEKYKHDPDSDKARKRDAGIYKANAKIEDDKVNKRVDKLIKHVKPKMNKESVSVQEISTGLASRYLKKTDPETSSPKEVEKRKTGRALALTKKWGGKVGGTAAPKVPTKD